MDVRDVLSAFLPDETKTKKRKYVLFLKTIVNRFSMRFGQKNTPHIWYSANHYLPSGVMVENNSGNADIHCAVEGTTSLFI